MRFSTEIKNQILTLNLSTEIEIIFTKKVELINF